MDDFSWGLGFVLVVLQTQSVHLKLVIGSPCSLNWELKTWVHCGRKPCTVSTQGTQIYAILTYIFHHVELLNGLDSSFIWSVRFSTLQIIEWWLHMWTFTTLRDSTYYDCRGYHKWVCLSYVSYHPRHYLKCGSIICKQNYSWQRSTTCHHVSHWDLYWGDVGIEFR